MSKKIFTERQYNLGIVESYKPSDKSHTGDNPVLGSFSVKGMAVEDMVSQNRTRYSKDVWSQPTAFGVGGKYISESGKLRPSTLFGSVDHPLDNRAELLLQEAAIAWYDVKRNGDGSWDGSADILNNPQGRLVKTFLDYVKKRGGGELLGVSSRALGESVLSESNGEQFEAIVPESFELMSFDFVYNPSFQTAVAKLNESKGSRVSLVESVRKLAEEDEENSKYYEAVADGLEKEVEETLSKTKKEENKDLLTEEQLKDLADGKELKTEAKDEMAELEKELAAEFEEYEASKDSDEDEEDLEDVDEDVDEDEEDVDEDEDEEDVDEEDEDEEDVDEEEVDENVLLEKIERLEELVQKIADFLMPVEDPEAEFGDLDEEDEEDLEDIDIDEEDEEDVDEEDEESELGDLSEEDLDELSDEELEYLANLEV